MHADLLFTAAPPHYWLLLLLLQRGGRVTYFGPLGRHSSALISYLQDVPGVLGRLACVCMLHAAAWRPRACAHALAVAG